MSRSRREKRKQQNPPAPCPPTLGPAEPNAERADESSLPSISCDRLADLVIDFWRLEQRARRDSGSERLLTACERIEDRLRRLGFDVDTLQDRPYSENLRVRVIEHEPAIGARIISECLSPAIYFQGKLIREAEVVTRGTGELNQ
jgi:hypothetical protein